MQCTAMELNRMLPAAVCTAHHRQRVHQRRRTRPAPGPSPGPEVQGLRRLAGRALGTTPWAYKPRLSPTRADQQIPPQPHRGSAVLNGTYRNNADAHMKRQIMGREVVVAITNGRSRLVPVGADLGHSRASWSWSLTGGAGNACWSRSSVSDPDIEAVYGRKDHHSVGAIIYSPVEKR
jgi:hypothetical protein